MKLGCSLQQCGCISQPAQIHALCIFVLKSSAYGFYPPCGRVSGTPAECHAEKYGPTGHSVPFFRIAGRGLRTPGSGNDKAATIHPCARCGFACPDSQRPTRLVPVTRPIFSCMTLVAACSHGDRYYLEAPARAPTVAVNPAGTGCARWCHSEGYRRTGRRAVRHPRSGI